MEMTNEAFDTKKSCFIYLLIIYFVQSQIGFDLKFNGCEMKSKFRSLRHCVL